MVFEALALAVGPVLTADVGALVPLDPEPLQAVQDGPLVLGAAAIARCVLDPQHEGPAGAAGEQVVVERRAGVADVKESRRTGRHAVARLSCKVSHRCTSCFRAPGPGRVVAGRGPRSRHGRDWVACPAAGARATRPGRSPQEFVNYSRRA